MVEASGSSSIVVGQDSDVKKDNASPKQILSIWGEDANENNEDKGATSEKDSEQQLAVEGELYDRFMQIPQ